MKSGTRIVFLGTNGWYDTETGSTISILLDCGGFSLILDAGLGIHRLDRYIDFTKPAYLFLSHFHLDHIYGLHVLNKFRFREGLTIFGQTGTREILGSIMKSPFTVSPENLRYRTEIREVPGELGSLPFTARVVPLEHSSPVLGLRLEIDGKIIAYCPDTGPCPGAVELSRGAHALIAECAYLPGETDSSWPHLNPESAAAIALDAGAERLFLVHFDASRYPSRESRIEAEKAARVIFPPTESAYDGLIIEL